MKQLLSLLVLIVSLGLYAQDTNRRGLSLHTEYGFIILHSQAVRPMGQSYPYGAGLDYSYWLLKEKHWKNCHCYPRIGLSLNYHNFQNPTVLGWGLPLYGFLEPSYRLHKNFFFNLRGGFGYSWLSNPYDAETNPLNQSYSMHFTPFAMVGFGFMYRLSPHWQVNAQLKYNHASNGGQREPNKGLNYPTASLGISHTWGDLPLKQKPKIPLEDLDLKRSIVISSFIAGKAIDATRVTYSVPGLEVKYSHQVGRVSALAGGVEWISNFAYRELIRQRKLGEDHNQIALLLGHEFLMGNFTFTQLAGIYLYKDFDITPDWYQRYGVVWYPFGNFLIGSQIKVHGHVAEFLDFRIGYRVGL